MEIGKDKLQDRHSPLWVTLYWHTTTVITDRCRPIAADSDLNPSAESRKMLIDRVVENLKNTIVQPTFIRVSDVHTRPFAYGLQTLQPVDLFPSVLLSF